MTDGLTERYGCGRKELWQNFRHHAGISLEGLRPWKLSITVVSALAYSETQHPLPPPQSRRLPSYTDIKFINFFFGGDSCWDKTKPFFSVGKKNQLDVTFRVLYFSSNSSSTCFGQPCAHHQELTTAWYYSLVLVSAVAAVRLSRPVGR